MLASLGIGAVVCVMFDEPDPLGGITYHHLQVSDSQAADSITAMAAGLPGAVAFIRKGFALETLRFSQLPLLYNLNLGGQLESGNKVLVHCSSGISRSATVTLAFLVTAMLMPLRAAWDLVSSKRRAILPNNSFYKVMPLYCARHASIVAYIPLMRQHCAFVPEDGPPSPVHRSRSPRYAFIVMGGIVLPDPVRC